MTNKPQVAWQMIFDSNSMAGGMPPDFMHKLLNERPVFARHGKLLTSILWLQSQMIGLIYLHENEDLREKCKEDNGRNLPHELGKATLKELERLSSESLRIRFLKCFGSSMSEDLKLDLAHIILYRDGLCHGYVSLFQQIVGPQKDSILWSPRTTPTRKEILEKVTGSKRPPGSYFQIGLTELQYDEHIKTVCRIMDFIASQLDQWDIIYPTFA